MDTSAYLDRMGYTGPALPTLATLKALHRAHLFAIPFENLDIHYGREIHLEIDALEKKVIPGKRGGFCYELNGLFFHLLQAFGFEVKRISCRVHSTEKNAYGPLHDHLATWVRLAGESYLADVGYGAFAHFPLKIQLHTEQEDPAGTFRMVEHEGGVIRVEKQVESGWKPEYIFRDTPYELEDFAAMCRYQQFDPGSHFRKKKMITRPTDSGRITLTSDELKITQHGEVQEIAIQGDRNFEEKLWEYFTIKLP